MKDTASPAITVLMSVYNGAPFLAKAIESMLAQTYSNFEFIIVNDGSTDTTATIIDGYQIDPRVRIITHPTSLGLTKSLNDGVREARAPYIARMDADDVSLPERLAIQKEFLDANPGIACVGTGSFIVDEHGKQTGAKSPSTDESLLKFHMMLKNQITHPSVMIRTAILKKYAGYNETLQYAQDYDLWSRMLADGQRITNIAEALIQYRFHPHSITQGHNSALAYACATKTIYTNLLRYVPHLSEKTFTAFLASLHKRRTDSLSDVLSVRAFLTQFMRAYIEKETPPAHARTEMKKYVSLLKTQALQWYVKKRFNVLYRLIKKI